MDQSTSTGGEEGQELECMYLITICGLDLVPIHWMGVGEGGAAEPGSYIIYSLYIYTYVYIYTSICVCVCKCVYVCALLLSIVKLRLGSAGFHNISMYARGLSKKVNVFDNMAR